MRRRGIRRGLRGYDAAQVEAFLARCLTSSGVSRSRFRELRRLTPAGPPVTAAEVEQVRFDPAGWGCSVRQVDDLLDRVVAALQAAAPPVVDLRLPDGPAPERPFVVGRYRPRT